MYEWTIFSAKSITKDKRQTGKVGPGTIRWDHGTRDPGPLKVGPLGWDHEGGTMGPGTRDH